MTVLVIGGVLWFLYADGVPHLGFMMLAVGQQILIHKLFGIGLDNHLSFIPIII
jgi:hypothetical protein